MHRRGRSRSSAATSPCRARGDRGSRSACCLPLAASWASCRFSASGWFRWACWSCPTNSRWCAATGGALLSGGDAGAGRTEGFPGWSGKLSGTVELGNKRLATTVSDDAWESVGNDFPALDDPSPPT
ncbi:hypothetical protein MPLB_1200057 [Mesorhizobium sp. ORS 3324]|nr:hypothetical protein MPLB_1200057 [Mesorhizobium sp. ORS 3324]